jgi:GTP-binding protein
VSDIPGTTRDSVDIPFVLGEGPVARHYRLIDTAGIRAQKRLASAVDAFSVARATESIRRADVVVWMIDGAEGPTRQDKKISDLIAEYHRGCVRVVNKWDLLDRKTKPADYLKALNREMPYLAHAPAQFISSRTGAGVRATIEVIDEVARQVATEVGTGLLNRTLRDAFERQLPPTIKGRRLKLFYAAQTGSRPLRIRLFVNDPSLRSGGYEHYLVNRLRDAFGLHGAPVVLQWRARREGRNPESAKT